jgi:alcohol dehydrogenase YqhD (iron-dependent ADH family)
MRSFNYFQPNEIRFGRGRLAEVGQVIRKYAQRCLVLTVPANKVFTPLFDRVKQYLREVVVEYHILKALSRTRQQIANKGRQQVWFRSIEAIGCIDQGAIIDT